MGHRLIYTASSINEAISKSQEYSPDLVLIDLATKNGKKFIDTSFDIKKLDIPVIFLTPPSEESKIKKADESEPYEYLIKPYENNELKYLIKFIIYKNKAEKELKVSEKYYKTIFEHTGAATVIIEEDTTISLANPEFEKLSGYSREEIEGIKSWTDFVVKEDLEKMREYHYLRRNHSDLAPEIYDFKFIDKKGAVKDIHLDIGMIPGTKKSVASLLDVTSRKNAFIKMHELFEVEHQARSESDESKKLITTVLERISDSFMALDTHWNYTYINKKAAKNFGKTPVEMVGENIWTMFPEGIGQPFYKACHQALEKQKHIHLEEYCPPYDCWFENDIYPSEDGITIFFKDITRAKKVEETLKKNEEKYRYALDNMMEGCQIIGYDWRYLYVNDAVAQHGRYEKEELMGHTMMEMYPGIEDTELCNVLEICMKERISKHLDNKFTYPDGSVGWFELSIHPVPEGLFILSIDITDRVKRQDELSFKNTMLEEKIKKAQEKFGYYEDD